MNAQTFPILVATSVSEWARDAIDSLTLVATPTKPKPAAGYRIRRE